MPIILHQRGLPEDLYAQHGIDTSLLDRDGMSALYCDRQSILDETFDAEQASTLVGHFLAGGDLDDVRVEQAIWRSYSGVGDAPSDRESGHFGFCEATDWPFPSLRVYGYYYLSGATKGVKTWRHRYPTSWSIDDAYEFQRDLDHLMSQALVRDSTWAAVDAALIAEQYDFARGLVRGVLTESGESDAHPSPLCETCQRFELEFSC